MLSAAGPAMEALDGAVCMPTASLRPQCLATVLAAVRHKLVAPPGKVLMLFMPRRNPLAVAHGPLLGRHLRVSNHWLTEQGVKSTVWDGGVRATDQRGSRVRCKCEGIMLIGQRHVLCCCPVVRLHSWQSSPVSPPSRDCPTPSADLHSSCFPSHLNSPTCFVPSSLTALPQTASPQPALLYRLLTNVFPHMHCPSPLTAFLPTACPLTCPPLLSPHKRHSPCAMPSPLTFLLHVVHPLLPAPFLPLPSPLHNHNIVDYDS